MAFNENTRVKIPAILHLCRLGYTYISLSKANWDINTNIFTSIFSESLKRINKDKAVEDFTVVVSYDQIKEKNYSLSAGQYFDVKIEYTDITPEAFTAKMDHFQKNLDSLFAESHALEIEIKKQLGGLTYG